MQRHLGVSLKGKIHLSHVCSGRPGKNTTGAMRTSFRVAVTLKLSPLWAGHQHRGKDFPDGEEFIEEHAQGRTKLQAEPGLRLKAFRCPPG